MNTPERTKPEVVAHDGPLDQNPNHHERKLTMTYDTSSSIQRARILKYLEEAGSKGASTIELREQLDIMMPAPRIKELREDGYEILTRWTITENAQGNKHRNARYVLIKLAEAA